MIARRTLILIAVALGTASSGCVGEKPSDEPGATTGSATDAGGDADRDTTVTSTSTSEPDLTAADATTAADTARVDTANPDMGMPPAIWSPAPGTSWQWQLSGGSGDGSYAVDTSFDVDVYDIDLFETPVEVIRELEASDRRVICYFSAGTWEPYRPDADRFPDDVLGAALPDWPDERWVDHRSPAVRTIMASRLDLAAEKGCSAVEPDNVDSWNNAPGFELTREDQVAYLLWLSSEAHARGLSVGLKNALGLVPDVVDQFDWALNEECLSYDECTDLAPFVDAGKAVFHVEYVDTPGEGPAKLSDICSDATRARFSSLVKTWDLDPFRLACP